MNKTAWACALVALFAVNVTAADLPAIAGEVTLSKDIAPILQRSCQNCHQPDSVAPMPLITYRDARPWAKAIKTRTALRDKPGVMPPWYGEKNIGIQHFKNDNSLSDLEIAKIAKWADSGAPEGNPADLPPPRQLGENNRWTAGEPDLIVPTQWVTVKAGTPFQLTTAMRYDILVKPTSPGNIPFQVDYWDWLGGVLRGRATTQIVVT